MRANPKARIFTSVVALALTLSLAGCAESDEQRVRVSSEINAAAQALPGSLQQPSYAGATAGSGTTKSYRVTFSLGGALPPMKSDRYRLNHPTTDTE